MTSISRKKQNKKNKFNFKFVGNLSIRFNKVNAQKVSSWIKSPDWFRYKNATINSKILMIDVSSILLRSHSTIKKLDL